MSTRTEIAEAVNVVDGFTAYPYVVAEVEPGTVYPRLDRIEYPNPFGGVAHWQVVLVLPQDLAEAEQYLEANLPALRTAVEPHLVITASRPERLEIPGVGVLPVAFLIGHREADAA